MRRRLIRTATAVAKEIVITETRNGDWIQVRSGGRFYPLDPRPEEVFIEDVAFALSNVTRFSGHCEFYSVAQHSVLVSRHCDQADALFGLLHDSAEAYICDLSRPVKQSLRRAGIVVFDTIEGAIMDAVCQRFGLPLIQPESVDRADVLLLATEARDLMAPLTPGWRHTVENGYPVLEERIVPWTPLKARQEFLARFAELGGKAS